MAKRAILLSCLIVALAMLAGGVVRAVGGEPSPWLSGAPPNIGKSIDLEPNTFPSTTNFDCVKTSVKVYLSSDSRDDCMVSMPLGQASDNGIVLNGSDTSIPITPPFPFQGLKPIPNQGMFMTFTSAQTTGSYMHFYTSIYDKLPPLPRNVGGLWQFMLTKDPDFTLRGADGKALAVNPNALAFSPNGNWMVVDVPHAGLVRLNMATFEMQPIATSMNQVGDYANYNGQLSISYDGRYVVSKPGNLTELNVYDLTTCASANLPVVAGDERCARRNYWDDITAQIGGFRALYQPRFTNNLQLEFSAVYNYAPGNFQTARYSLTSPGTDPSGINYLGMGDSFASGEGAFGYKDGTDTDNDRCHLSTRNYAFLFSEQLFSSGHTVACSGAKTVDIADNSQQYKGQVKDQIEKRKRSETYIESIKSSYTPGYLAQSEFIDQYRPDAITLSIGGNDIGFADILKNCVSPVQIHTTCYPDYEDRQELYKSVSNIFDRLVSTYTTLYKPGKRVYVVGYPQIAVTGGNCAANVHMNEDEIQLSIDLIDHLNDLISRAADKAGVRYVDVSQALKGHRLCETKSWDVAVNGLTSGKDGGVGSLRFIGSESYHPNVLAHELLAQTIRLKTSNLTQPMPGGNAAQKAPGLPASLDLRGLPKSNRPTNLVVADSDLAPDVTFRNQPLAVSLNSGIASLKPGATYRVMLGQTMLPGSVAADSNGRLSASLTVPSAADIGFQPLHVLGPNLLGQSIDVTKSVYVGASDKDYDGNGTPDSGQSCVFVPMSGTDLDKDGIDDSCDPVIMEVPPQKLSHLHASVTLTNNSITLKR